MSNETVSIQNCPHCRNSHTYKLEVERAYLVKMLDMSDMFEQPRKVRVTRLFVCPVKNEQYQGTFYLQESSSDIIKDVRVIGLASEKKDD